MGSAVLGKHYLLRALMLITFLISSTTNVSADIVFKTTPDFVPYFYGGAGLGYSFVEPERTDNTGILRISDDQDSGYRLHVGYHWRARWSFDLAYSDLGAAEVQILQPVLVFGEIRYRIPAVYANYHVEQNYIDADIFTKGGLSFLKSSTDNPFIPFREVKNTAQLMTGIGIFKDVYKGWGVRGDLDLYSRDAAMISVGIQKSFKKELPKDTDRDGVIDLQDQCPNTPMGYPVDALGCALDGDKDGVYDPFDQCLETPLGDKIDEFGCTVPTEAEIVEEALLDIDLKGINFEVNSDQLTEASKLILDEAAAVLIANESVKLRIEAHTDSDGSAKYNLRLSDKRAKSVESYLAGAGVAADRLSAEGFGEANPIADNATKEGKALNRRVEFILEQEEVAPAVMQEASPIVAPVGDSSVPLEGDTAIPEGQLEELQEKEVAPDDYTEEDYLEEYGEVEGQEEEVEDYVEPSRFYPKGRYSNEDFHEIPID